MRVRLAILAAVVVACGGGDNLAAPPSDNNPITQPTDSTPPADTLPSPPQDTVVTPPPADTTTPPPADTVPTPPDTLTPPPVDTTTQPPADTQPWSLRLVQSVPATWQAGVLFAPELRVQVVDTLGAPAAAGVSIVADLLDVPPLDVNSTVLLGAESRPECAWPPLPTPIDCRIAATDAGGVATFAELRIIGPGTDGQALRIRFTVTSVLWRGGRVVLDPVSVTTEPVLVVDY